MLLTDFKTNLQETQIQREGFERVSTFASLSHKNGFVFVNQIWRFKALKYYFRAHNIRFRLLTDFKTSLQETLIQREGFGRISTFTSLFQKNGFVFVKQIQNFKALNHLFQAHKIRFTFFIDFKVNFQETQIYGKSFRRVSTFASLSQKNCFVFMNQIWNFKS